jgi:hypothetical protein
VLLLQAGFDKVTTAVNVAGVGRYGDYSASCLVNDEVWLAAVYALPVGAAQGQFTAGLWVASRINPEEDSIDPFLASDAAIFSARPDRP